MKLIVDSGSTKADWIAIDDFGKIIFKTNTLGLNPEVLNENQLLERVNAANEIVLHKSSVTYLHFYGAGCGTDRMKIFLSDFFTNYFPNAVINIFEDTYAAVFATTAKNEKAIVCILGTGSNCSYYDGEILHQKVQSLGYIAMDDCSGNRFGRELIRGYYFNSMPKDLSLKFEKKYNLNADFIKNKLYKEPNPNAYLASLAPFLIEQKNTSFCQKIIQNEIDNFVEFYIKQFENCTEVPVHFIGSIAFHLKDEINNALMKSKIKLGKIVVKPIDGLINYHLKN